MTFPSLLEAALEGTLRHAPPAVLAAEDEAAELRLLRGAAFEGIRRLAGRLPAVDHGAPPAPSPSETLPEVSAAAAGRLLELFGGRRDLVPEWLELARAHGRRVPHAILPDVLEQMREQPRWREAFIAVGGERLPWLAAQNPAWSFAARFDPVDRFHHGELAERRRALRVLRRQDMATARTLLADSWSTESGAARLALLPELGVGRASEDEPLLQRALHDRRKDVRQAALELLRRLPSSAFARRWAERARTLVHVGSKRIDIKEPRTVPGEWLADGLELRVPRGAGATAWILTQVVAFAPPSHWSVEMLPSVLDSDWAAPLVQGLSQAAATYADVEWAEALLKAFVQAAARDEVWPIEPERLFDVLAVERAEAVLRQTLQAAPQVAAGLLAGRQVAWSEAFSRFFVQHLPELLTRWQYTATAPLGQAGLQLDPAVWPELSGVIGASSAPKWTAPLVDRLARTLEVRQAMRRELA